MAEAARRSRVGALRPFKRCVYLATPSPPGRCATTLPMKGGRVSSYLRRTRRFSIRSPRASAYFSVKARAAGLPRRGPTESAMIAPRSPIGRGAPTVVSSAV
ncbi:hypothetical protein D3C72_2157960 [compost metagenome]